MNREIPWELILSKFKQEISATDDEILSLWLVDEEHKALYQELYLLWNKAREEVSDYSVDKNYYWRELERQISVGMKREVDHVIDDEALHQPTIIKKGFNQAHLYRYISAACVILTIVVSASLYLGIKIGRPSPIQQTYVNWGGKSEVLLPDGSNVSMHSKTTLKYNIDYESKERLISVVGEAFFDVAHDQSKPFIVQTDGLKIVVHGTKFNVESFPDSDNIYVSLKEGLVSLETAKEKRFLNPGEVADFNKRNHQLQIKKGNVKLNAIWANNEIAFNDKPLGYICVFLSKWYHVDIKLSDKLSDKYRFTFTLRHESLEEVMRIMSRINPIKYQFDEKNKLIIEPE